ncbi:hypothetical protein GCM10010442_58780 [Kitasatospora kifunensis]
MPRAVESVMRECSWRCSAAERVGRQAAVSPKRPGEDVIVLRSFVHRRRRTTEERVRLPCHTVDRRRLPGALGSRDRWAARGNGGPPIGGPPWCAGPACSN